MTDAQERLERLEAALLRLREAAEGATVVVEGPRDLAALQALGVGGHHATVHRGDPLEAVAGRLAAAPQPIVLLLDWDRAGGRLARRLGELLHGRARLAPQPRRELAAACRSRCLEDVPAELASLRASA